MELTRNIKMGDTGEDVKHIQQILKQQGYYKGSINGTFNESVREAVFWFQATHIGPNRLFLDADSVVGPNTWWALHNASGDPQANKIEPIIPSGINEDRMKVLAIAINEYKKGVHEVPDGSNWGPEIEKYGGKPGWAWCSLFMNWCYKQALGVYPTGILSPSCFYTWKEAEKKGTYHSKSVWSPIPGDIFIMQYRDSQGKLNGQGHTGIVLRVSEDGKLFNAIEGNTSNRVKCTLREVASSKLIGFISPYQSGQATPYEKGVLLGNITEESLISTR